MIEVKNARIRRTFLGVEDHGILSCMIDMDYGTGGQSFGGHCFDEPIRENRGFRRRGTAFGMEYIRRILEVLELDSWEKLPGTFCRVRTDDRRIEAIGHPLNERWFEPEKLCLEYWPGT